MNRLIHSFIIGLASLLTVACSGDSSDPFAGPSVTGSQDIPLEGAVIETGGSMYFPGNYPYITPYINGSGNFTLNWDVPGYQTYYATIKISDQPGFEDSYNNKYVAFDGKLCTNQAQTGCNTGTTPDSLNCNFNIASELKCGTVTPGAGLSEFLSLGNHINQPIYLYLRVCADNSSEFNCATARLDVVFG